jgi:hypothetical protein
MAARSACNTLWSCDLLNFTGNPSVRSATVGEAPVAAATKGEAQWNRPAPPHTRPSCGWSLGQSRPHQRSEARLWAKPQPQGHHRQKRVVTVRRTSASSPSALLSILRRATEDGRLVLRTQPRSGPLRFGSVPAPKFRTCLARPQPVAQAFQPAGLRNFLVPRCSRPLKTGDWKVPRTRRQECLRYGAEQVPDSNPLLFSLARGRLRFLDFRERD